MKKLLTFITLLLITILVFGQEKAFQYRIWIGERQYNQLSNKFEEGEVNLSNGEFVYGLINRDLIKPKITVVDLDTIVYEGDVIENFKIKGSSRVFSIKFNDENVFLQEVPIENGPIKIYTYDLILKEVQERTSGGNYVTTPIEYNKLVEIVLLKDGVYRKLKSMNDVYDLINDNSFVSEYGKNKLKNKTLSCFDCIYDVLNMYNQVVD